MYMDSIIAMSKISSKSQITIPKEVRELLKAQAGDKILFVKENGKILIKKA